MSKIGVVIAGGTGFGAGELLRLLTQHPQVEVVDVISQSSSAKSIVSLHPHLNGFYSKNFTEKFSTAAYDSFQKRVLFVAQPHGASAEFIRSIFTDCKKAGIRIIDLSGDLRLKDHTLHKEYYPTSELVEDLRSIAVYGLTELNKEKIARAEIVSNPGCLATAAIFALLPLAKFSCTGEIVANLTTGSSGAGRSLKDSTHHPLRHANMFAYKALNHQHEPEILQALNQFTAFAPSLSFVAHSLPVSRGIFGTIYATLKEALKKEELQKILEETYRGSPFVRVLPYGNSPELSNVVGTNFTDISVTSKHKKIVVTVALDNLVKGMAGQAIQNMNLMFGLDETTGLMSPALRVI